MKSQNINCDVPIYSTEAWSGDCSPLPPNQTYEITLDYPLSNPAKFKIKTGKKGLQITKLITKIGELYQKVYDQEDTFNRKHSDDDMTLYGIWGHSITDLVIEGISINHTSKKISLSIGS